MMKHLEIAKKLGLLLLLFILISTVAVSDNTYRVSVTIMQSSSSGKGGDANTVVNTFTKESNSPGTHVKCEISGSDSTVITNEKDTSPTESTNPGAIPPFLRFDGSTSEEFDDELSEWILSMIEKDMLTMTDEFPQDRTNIANVE